VPRPALPRRRATARGALRLAATLVLWATVALLSAAAAQDLPLDEVAAGDVGYALTEVGGDLRRFEVEVLAIRSPDGPGLPTILLRTSGPFLDEVGGVAAGMSGSPVYLGPPGQERLAGALAYAFPDSDHRLALATPIAAMRALGADGDGPVAPPGGVAPLGPAPLLLTGASPRAAALLAPALVRLGARAVPTQAGAAAGPARLERPLTPGDAVAIALVRGDLLVAAVGTVTDVRDERAWILGHPLLRAGPVELALFAADVPTIVPDRTLPYKLADVVGPDPIGTVGRDGQAGLIATLGSAPADLPLTVRVDAPDRSRTVAVRLARLPGLLPTLTALTVQETIDALRDRVGGGSAELAWEIELGDEPPLRLLDQRVDEADLAATVARTAAGPLAVLLGNPFRAPDLRRVALRIEIREERDHAELVEVALETPEVEPGGTVQAFLRIQPFRGEARVLTLAVPLPEEVPPGELVLTFRGASVDDPRSDEDDPPAAGPYEQATSGLPPLLSWGELIGALEDRPQARELLVEIPGEGRPRRLARTDVGALVTGLERVTVRIVDEGEDGTTTGGEE
jgi:hypothetical protein